MTGDIKAPLLASRARDEEHGDHDHDDRNSGGRTTSYYYAINGTGQRDFSPQSSATPHHPQTTEPKDITEADSSRAESPFPPSKGDEGEGEFMVYTRRWYILALYTLVSTFQTAVWNTFGPIAKSVEYVLRWSSATVALMTSTGSIAFLVTAIPLSWATDVKGLRISSIVTVLLVVLGTGIRCITLDPPVATWLMQAGQFISGMGGPVTLAMAPALSAAWFPAHQRATATAIGGASNRIGLALSFLLGPLLVSSNGPNSPDTFVNVTDARGNYLNASVIPVVQDQAAQSTFQEEKEEIAFYLYLEAGIAVALLLLVLPYFPSKPPLPPSPSAAITRVDFFHGFKSLLRRWQFWLVCAISGIPLGAFNSWTTFLVVILEPHGISQVNVGWVGFYGMVASIMTSIVMGRFADFFSRRLRNIILISYGIGAIFLLVFALADAHIIPNSQAIFFLAIIVGTMALNASATLTFELVCEMSYPAGEGITNTILVLCNVGCVCGFLALAMIPGIGSQWLTWVVVGTTAASLPLLMLLKEQYGRLDLDEHVLSLRHEASIPPTSRKSSLRSLSRSSSLLLLDSSTQSLTLSHASSN